MHFHSHLLISSIPAFVIASNWNQPQPQQQQNSGNQPQQQNNWGQPQQQNSGGQQNNWGQAAQNNPSPPQQSWNSPPPPKQSSWNQPPPMQFNANSPPQSQSSAPQRRFTLEEIKAMDIKLANMLQGLTLFVDFRKKNPGDDIVNIPEVQKLYSFAKPVLDAADRVESEDANMQAGISGMQPYMQPGQQNAQQPNQQSGQQPNQQSNQFGQQPNQQSNQFGQQPNQQSNAAPLCKLRQTRICTSHWSVFFKETLPRYDPSNLIGSSSMNPDGEKASLPMSLQTPLQAYPAIPPPTYTAATGDSTAGTSFVAIPAMRYDTMTSYVEDGSGVQTVITAGAILDRPIMVRCPFCKTTVTTETKPTTGCLTWLCCLAMSAVGLVYGCCLLPFCSTRLRDVEHICPKCHNLIALYKRI